MAKPIFTSIEGGKKGPPEPPDYDDGWSREHLHKLIVELLRALARGDDAGFRVGSELFKFIEHFEKTKAPAGTIIDSVIRELHQSLASERGSERAGGELEQIVLSSLQLAAEMCADDPAAKGRASRRRDNLTSDVERYIIEHELRSRENDWSYLKKLAERLPPAPRPKKPTR